MNPDGAPDSPLKQNVTVGIERTMLTLRRAIDVVELDPEIAATVACSGLKVPDPFQRLALEMEMDFHRDLRADLARVGLPPSIADDDGLTDDDLCVLLDHSDVRAAWSRAPEPEPVPIVSADEPTTSYNEATVYGELDAEMLSRKLSLASSPNGATTSNGRWRNWKTTVGGLLNRLSKHEQGEKDGACFLQGPVIDGERQMNAVPHLDLLVLDLDTGEDIDTVRRKIQELGLFAAIYTTHSHLKSVSDVKKDAIVKWLGEGAPPPDVDSVRAYLMDVKRYRPNILEGAKLLDQEHTKHGIKLFIEHKPMPKFRVVFLLKEPFVIADRATTQQAAITEWKERYAGASKLLGAYFDRSCVDPSRLFYSPRHPKGAKEWRIEFIAGKPLDIETVDRVTQDEVRKSGMSAFEQAAEEMQSGVYRTSGLKRFAARYGDRFDAETFMMDREPDGDRGSRSSGPGRSHRCPGDDDHTNAGDDTDVGFFVVNASEATASNGFVMHCRHDGCTGRDRLALLDLFCDKVGIPDAEALLEWVPEIEGEDRTDSSQPASAPKQRPKRSGKKDESDNEALFRGFSDEWAFVAEGAGGRFVKALPDGNLEFRGVDALTKRYAHTPVVFFDSAGNAREKPLVAEWLRWRGSASRKFDGLRFAPGKRDDQTAPYLNTWRGLGVQPKPGSWSRLRAHLEEVVADGNEKDARFLLGWMAFVVQHLGDHRKKLTISPVIRGDEGAGKSIVFDYYRRIFGRHGVVLSKPEQIVGRFNASLAEALVVQLEEAFFAGDPKIDGPLKDLLTGKEITIERKNIDPVSAPNFAHFVVISNAERPVPIKEGSRRYYAIQASSRKANQPAWFDPIIEEMESGGIEAMAWDLLNWTPGDGGWGFLREFPRSAANDRMIAAGLLPLERFILEWAHEGGAGFGFGAPHLLDAGEARIASADLAAAFKAWAEENGEIRTGREPLKTDAATIGLKIKQMLPSVEVEHGRTGNTRVYPTRARVIEMLRLHPSGGYRAYLERLEASET